MMHYQNAVAWLISCSTRQLWHVQHEIRLREIEISDESKEPSWNEAEEAIWIQSYAASSNDETFVELVANPMMIMGLLDYKVRTGDDQKQDQDDALLPARLSIA